MFLKEILSAGERGDAWVPASLLPQLLRQDTQVGKIKYEEADIGKRVDNIGENVKRNSFENICVLKSLRTDFVWIQISIHTI